MTRSNALIFGLLVTLVITMGVQVSPINAHGFGGVVELGQAPEMEGRPSSGCPGQPSLGVSQENASVADPIWTYDGSLHLSYTDLTVGRNLPIAITRSYDSRSEYDSAIGYGWAFSFDRRLFEYPDGSIVVRTGCGSRSRFVLTGGAFVAPKDGMQGQLTAQGNGTYELRHPGGSIDHFDADGRLSMMVSPSGARHELIYDARGRLPLIGTSPRSLTPNVPMLVAYQPRVTRIQERGADGTLTGYFIDLQYNDATGRVTKVIANDGREVNYGFDVTGTATRGNLISVSGLNDYSQTFAYVVSSTNTDPHNITAITDGTGAATVTNEYDAQDRVVEQSEGATTWTLAYPAVGTTTVTQKVRNAAGTSTIQTRTRTQYFDPGGYLTKEVDALGHETRYFYDGSRNINRTELWEKQGATLVLLKAVDRTHNGQGQVLTESVTLDRLAGEPPEAPQEVVTTTRTYDNGWVSSIQTVSSKNEQKVFRTEFTFLRDEQDKPIAIAQLRRRKDDGTFVTTTFTYCTSAEVASANSTCPDTALIKQVDGPRTDVSDIVTFTYYGTTDTSGCVTGIGNCWRRGDRKAITNAIGQTMTFLRYNSAGRLTKMRDANNVVAEMTYHPRGWVVEQIVRGPDDGVTTDDQITSFLYDPRGNVTKLTAPDGNYIDLTYDNRNRLTKSRDQAGNEQRYTYDSADNPMTAESWVTIPSNSRKRTQTFTVDALDRVTQVEGSTAAILNTFAYDAAGRQTTITDPNLVQSMQVYDDLDRLIATVSDIGTGGLLATTGMSYDAVGNLLSVVDPKGLATNYVYDALGRLTLQISPDSGTTGYTYDNAGNRASKTDARGVTATYIYDALNRPLTITYPTSAENVSFLYDTPNAVCQTGETFSTGRLSKLTDQSGTTEFCYDRFGNIARKVQTVGTQVQAVRYGYDKANRLASLTYPDGTVADYARDTQGRVSEVGVTPAGGTRQILLNNTKYLPDGPASNWQYGNGRSLTRTYDLNYRATGIRDPGAGGLDIGYVYDNASYLKQITTESSGVVRAKFEYDSLGRLTARNNAADNPQEEYAYDNTGNRTSAAELHLVPDPNAPPGGGGTIEQLLATSYTYATDSHRLTQVGGMLRSYDAAGNLLVIGNKSGPGGTYDKEFFYNDANRMKQVNTGDSSTTTVLATYLYNGFGEQVQRQTSVTTRFLYHEGGQLLGQYDINGVPIQQYVWLDGQPVGVIVPPLPPQEGQPTPLPRLWYVQSDVLGTPRAIIDPVRNLAVWRWDEMKEGFGDHAPQTDPDNDGTQVVFDLRFAGQRFDAASGLQYNYFRDYDPATGRYIQSDPIGLSGGISTYGYVGGRPTSSIDPLGLSERSWYDVIGMVEDFFAEGSYNLQSVGYAQGAAISAGELGHAAPDAQAVDAIRERLYQQAEQANFVATLPLGFTPGPIAAKGAVSCAMLGFSIGGRRTAQQYTLRAASSGWYPVARRGIKQPVALTWLEQGEVWKFGKTINPLTRYSQTYLRNTGNGLIYRNEFSGTATEALRLERMKIENYYRQYGRLPPGNKVRR